MKKIVMCLIFSGVAIASRGQSCDSLLLTYRRMALEYNHDLKASQKNISSSIELIKSAKDDLKPRIDGNVNFQYTGNPMELTLNLPSAGIGPVLFQGESIRYGGSVSLLQPVYTGGRILETIRLYQRQHSFATNTFDMLRNNVCYQTDIQYWNTVASIELHTLYESFCQSIRRLQQTVKERVDAGVSDPQDLLMVDVKLNDATYQLLRSQNNVTANRMALNSLIGQELDNIIELGARVSPSVSDYRIEPSAYENRPEIRMAYDKIMIRESDLRLTDAKYKPQFSVGAEGNYTSPGYNFKRELTPNYALYAKISVPIFDWGRRRSDKQANRYRVDMARDDMNRVTDAVKLEIETARINLDQSTQRVDLTKNSLEKAAQNELKSLERYNEGKASIVEVIDAQVYRQTAQINFVQAKLAMQSSYSELIKALDGYNLK